MKNYIILLFTAFFIQELGASGETTKPLEEKPSTAMVIENDHAQTTKKPSENNAVVRGGWYPWKPYQYLENPSEPSSLTGLDIDISRLIYERLGKGTTITELGWKEHQQAIIDGTKDFAMGAFDTPARRKLFRISEFYRFEENSFYVLRKNAAKFPLSNVTALLNAWKTTRLKIGVISGYSYADDELNAFISDPKNAAKVVFSETDQQNLLLLKSEKIDGFLADRIVGANLITETKSRDSVVEVFLKLRKPIHMLMSKDSISPAVATQINETIKTLKSEDVYRKTLLKYISPVVLMQTVDTDWFVFIEGLGIISFAIAGYLTAVTQGVTLFGSLLMGIIPAVGGGVFRDVLLGRHPIWLLQAENYLLMIIVICLFVLTPIYFLLSRIQGKQSILNKNSTSHKYLDFFLILCDAIGLAAFTVTGVLVALSMGTDPLWFWGPFFAFLTGAGGGIIRDIILNMSRVDAIHGAVYGENAVIWGGILSYYLHINAVDLNPDELKFVIGIVLAGIVLTRMGFYVLRIPNIRFKKET